MQILSKITLFCVHYSLKYNTYEENIFYKICTYIIRENDVHIYI